jgi:hypothetical protein
MRILAGLVAAPFFTALMPAPASAQHTEVLAYHGYPSRSGHLTVPVLTWEKARGAHLDAGFDGRFSGHVYAQPLFWRGGVSGGLVLVATEDDTIYALDAASGRAIWTRSLGKPATRSSLPCGDIDPLGITGTPVIDEAKGAVYLDAMMQEASGPRHRVFALSVKDGSVLPGWPVDVGAALAAQHKSFDPRVQNERGALLLLEGTLFVPFGGHFGDCGDYHGWVVGFPLDNPKSVRAWETRASGGGIWAPGGISSDGRSLFVATGNTFGASRWNDGEAVFRLAPSLARSERKEDFFAPDDWKTLDEEDADLGGSNPLPIELTAGAQPEPLILALGKDRRAYLLDRRDLGGIGGSIAATTVAKGPIRTAPASYPAADGTFVAFQGEGADCPGGKGGDLTVLRIRAGSPPSISTAWCGAMHGRGSPMVTTTDGHANPIVWILGAEGDDRLHAFRGDTGEPLVSLGGLSGLRRFQTLIAADDRLYVAADGRLYAVAF